MKYYIIAGEASGDLHGSNLIKALFKQDENAIVRCWGGDLMENAGATLVKHYKELAFMGFVEVLANIPTIFKNIAFCKKDIEVYTNKSRVKIKGLKKNFINATIDKIKNDKIKTEIFAAEPEKNENETILSSTIRQYFNCNGTSTTYNIRQN